VFCSRLIKESSVPSSEQFESHEIENQCCLTCQAPMVLTGVSTVRLDFDVRTFECFNCENADKVTTETKRGSPLSV